MAVSQIEYSYQITASYINGNKETPINSDSLNMALISYDYEITNNPIFILKLKLLTNVYNDMVKNQTTGKIVIGISKVNESSSTPIKYIKKQFSYYFPIKKWADQSTNMDGSNNEEARDNKDAYVNAAIGILDTTIMNANKMLINDIFKDTNSISILHHYFSLTNLRLIIEPFDFIEPIDLCILPPLEGLSKLVQYMNTMYSYYETDYRFFMDYNYTYLLSNKGTPIDIKDGTYTTMEIEVDDEGKGVITDNKQKIYIVQVDEDVTTYKQDSTTDKMFNNIYGVLSNGDKSVSKLDIIREHDSKDKYKIVRVPNDNVNYLSNMKNRIEIHGNRIELAVTNVDTTLFVPYKEFIFKFYNEQKELNGVYILCSKKEAFVSQGEGKFYCTLNMTFKKKC